MANSVAHRLEVVRANGEHMIRAYVMKVREIEARLWEINKNLHRAELSALERVEQIDEGRVLTADKVRETPSPSGGAQPKESGVRATARELGVDPKDVRYAAKVAAISDDAKEYADYWDWRETRESLWMGLSISGRTIPIVCVSLRLLVAWREQTANPLDEEGLDALAAAVWATRIL